MKFIEIFLLGSSLEKLNKIGSDSRESIYYNKFNEKMHPLIVEYSGKTTTSNNSIIKPKNISNIKFSLDYKNCVSKNLNNDFNFIRAKQILGSWLGIILKFKFKKPFFLRIGYSYANVKFHENLLGKLLYPLYTIFEYCTIILSDGIIFSSETLKNKYRFLTKFKKNIIIPNPVINDFIPNYKKFNNRKYNFIYVGRVIRVKGSDRLENIISELNNGVVIGHKSNKLNISNNTYIDRVSNKDVYSFYNDSKYYISFSRTEGSPKATIEAICCGCVPILSNIKIHREIINDLGYGFLVSDFSNTINILENKTNNYNINRHKLFLKKHSLDYCVEKEIDFYLNFFN